MLPQWHVKDPSYSAKSAGGRLHLNMYTPLTQRSRNGLTMPLFRHSVGTSQEKRTHTQLVREHSVTVVEPLWTDSGLKSGISVCELISIKKKKRRKAQAGNKLLNILPKLSHVRKKPPPIEHLPFFFFFNQQKEIIICTFTTISC